MQFASFGGLLKDFRTRKNLSQQEVAYAMGWRDPSRLSRIEQGITIKPSRETMDSLLKILKLDRNEQGQLLLAGGYVPTNVEIDAIRKEVKPLLDVWPYPAYLLDFAWRLIDWNEHAASVYQITGIAAEKIRVEVPSSLELTFSPDFVQNKYLTGKEEIEQWHKVLLEKLVRFRLINRGRTSEKWYKEFMTKMMKNELFATLWQKAQLASEERGIANYEFKSIVDAKDTQKRLNFHILRSPLLQDVRFEMNYHIAGDKETLECYQK